MPSLYKALVLYINTSLAFPATMLKVTTYIRCCCRYYNFCCFQSCSALVLAVLVFCCSSLVLSASVRPYQFSYQVKDLQQGLHFAAAENSDGAQVVGEYEVLLPGSTSTYSSSNRHIKR